MGGVFLGYPYPPFVNNRLPIDYVVGVTTWVLQITD